MKYLILTDIHGNSDALEAVLEQSQAERIDSVLVLGDLVGYGAGPNEVIDRLVALPQPTVIIRGNHDKVVAAALPDVHFNAVARRAVRWTTEQLTPENLAFLKELRQGPLEIGQGLFVCHGSPMDEDEYVISLEDAARVFSAHAGELTLFGHTHIPCCFSIQDERLEFFDTAGDVRTMELEAGVRYLANPGSVGQPRDRDPRAAYLVYDSDSRQIHWRRCDYPIETAQRRIIEAGLPEVLAHRLAVGI